MRTKKITPEVASQIKRLNDADFSNEEVAEILDLGVSTVAKLKTCGYDYESYSKYGRNNQLDITPTAIIPNYINEKLDCILEQQEHIIDGLGGLIIKKKKRPASEYNKFVRHEFEKNPNTNMAAVGHKWSKRNKKFFN